jgi:hypothetical protein
MKRASAHELFAFERHLDPIMGQDGLEPCLLLDPLEVHPVFHHSTPPLFVKIAVSLPLSRHFLFFRLSRLRHIRRHAERPRQLRRPTLELWRNLGRWKSCKGERRGENP